MFASPVFSQETSKIYTDDKAHDLKIEILSKADQSVRRFFADTFDRRVPQPIALIGTNAPETLDAHLSQALTDLGRRQRSRALDVVSLCKNKPIGAAANRAYIVMCWLEPKAFDDKWVASIERRLRPILAHEFTHQLQYTLAGDDPPKRITGTDKLLLGPSWMVEGSAEFFERLYAVQVQGARASETADQELFNLQTAARRSRDTLSQMVDTGTTKGRSGYGTARFAAYLLAQRHGPNTLLEYFVKLGELRDRDAAFEQVFGLSFAAFEQDFERVRRNFAAAKDYTVKGTQ